MTSNQEQLFEYSLGVIPNPVKLARALMRPNKPFVMINMLSFKQQATGDFAHLTGQEAYEQYAQSVQKPQALLGSRLLWSGHVQQNVIERNMPSFHSIALLEYASPKAFLKFLTKGGSNTKARAAGLNGQWLLASTTLEAGQLPGSGEENRVLVELRGGVTDNPEAAKQWQEDRNSTQRAVGSKTLWYGRCDHHILGTATPGIAEALVTWLPNTRDLEQVMSDPKRNVQLKQYTPYLAYIAHSVVDFLPELT